MTRKKIMEQKKQEAKARVFLLSIMAEGMGRMSFQEADRMARKMAGLDRDFVICLTDSIDRRMQEQPW